MKEYDVCFAMDDENHGFFRIVTVDGKNRTEAKKKGIKKIKKTLTGSEMFYTKKVEIHEVSESPWREGCVISK